MYVTGGHILTKAKCLLQRLANGNLGQQSAVQVLNSVPIISSPTLLHFYFLPFSHFFSFSQFSLLFNLVIFFLFPTFLHRPSSLSFHYLSPLSPFLTFYSFPFPSFLSTRVLEGSSNVPVMTRIMMKLKVIMK